MQVPKQYVKSRPFQESIVDEVVLQLARHASQWAFSIAFPELLSLPLHHLRAFAKRCAVERFRRQVKGLVDQVRAHPGCTAPPLSGIPH